METWIIAIIGWALLLFLWFKDNKKEKKRKTIHNEVNIIMKDKRLKNMPEDFKSHFRIIANASGISITDL